MSLQYMLKSFRKLNRIGDNIIVTNMIIKNIEYNRKEQINDIFDQINEHNTIQNSPDVRDIINTIPNSPDVRDIINTIPNNELYKHLDFLHHSQYTHINNFEKNMDNTMDYWNENKLCLNEYWTGY